MKYLNQYKSYLIRKLGNMAISSPNEALEKIDKFIQTKEGQRGYLDFEIMKLNSTHIDTINSIGKKAWIIYEKINPMAELEEF